MIVSGKYELLEVLQESGIRTYRARQMALGHLVMVHFIPGTETEDDYALLEQLAQLPDSERKLFFDAGEHESVPYLVSWPLPGFRSLPDWLDRTLGVHRPPPTAATPAPKTTRSDPSEFSRLFFSGLKEPADAEAAAAESGPGEFTQLFQKPSGGSAPPPPVQPKNAPDEFTALFQASSSSRPAGPAPGTPGDRHAEQGFARPPASGGPGEFTQFFQGNPAELPKPASGARAEPLWGEPQAPKQAPKPASPPSLRPAAQPPHDATLDLFKLPPSAAASAGPAAPPRGPVLGGATEALPQGPSVRPPSSPTPAGPGEYTMVLGRGPAQTGFRPPAAAPPVPAIPSVTPVARKPNYLPMWIGLGALLFLAVVLVLVFALTR